MPFIPITTPFNVDIEFEVAEFYKRLFAYAIDLCLMIIYLLSMKYLLDDGFHIDSSGLGFVLIVVMLPLLLYTLLSELWFNGQTLGKKIFKIKVVSLDGGEPSLEQYLLRWFMRFYEWGTIIFLLFWVDPASGIIILITGSVVSMVIILATSKNQRLGDIVAGTVVVNTRSKLTVNDTIFMNISEQDYKLKFQEVLRLSDRDINTIKNVLSIAQKNHKYDMVNKVASKVKEVLKISNDMYSIDFLEKILEDYNYLSTREA
jgi:uncharacterized RDD family membrane protein YckC